MDKRELPENIRQAIDLIAAVLRRIKAKELDKRRDKCLYIEKSKGGYGMMNESEVKRQLELLDLMNQAELREKFCDLFGFEPGQTNIANLRRRLAYRIQEIYYGGLSEADRQLLEQIADGDPQANLRYGKNGVFHVCGTRYQRVWKGKKYEVTALGNGKFEYDGTVYQSLSAIAREITGTRWNGKLFFGVK